MVKDSAREARESSIASGWTVEGSPEGVAVPVAAEPADNSVTNESGEAQQMSSGALVLFGLIGGIYLLYTTVWFSWTNFYSTINNAVAEGSGSIGSVLQQVVLWVAPLAPALWFVSVLVLGRGSATWRKAVWLVVGLIVLVPLPMFGGGA